MTQHRVYTIVDGKQLARIVRQVQAKLITPGKAVGDCKELVGRGSLGEADAGGTR